MSGHKVIGAATLAQIIPQTFPQVMSERQEVSEEDQDQYSEEARKIREELKIPDRGRMAILRALVADNCAREKAFR